MPTILLVEDNRMARTTSQHLLTRAGINVVVAEDGEQALKVAQTSAPDVILLDMLLPLLSGEKVLEALKKDPRTKAIPVIVLTGLSQKNERRLKHDGAAAFLEKNALMDNPQLLIKAIDWILHRPALSTAAPHVGVSPALLREEQS